MKGIITSVTPSKTGKSWRVHIGSEYYGAKFDSKLDTHVGKAIDFEVESDPKFGKWITSWGPDVSAPEPKIADLTITRTPLSDRWWLNFVSNSVAHAIAAGHIKTIQELRVWAVGARDAITKADGGDLPY